MAKTKSPGSSTLGRDSNPKYLGLKVCAGKKAKAGSILVRQRGTKFLPGKNVRRAGDDSLFALKEGVVKIKTKKKICFNRKQRTAKVVSVE